MTNRNLLPTLGLWTSVSMVIGGIIGSGIFMKPASMAGVLGSPTLLIGVWIFAGVITLFGALSNAEVATMIPETGGQYVFFQKMYGDMVAFLYGWAGFIVFNTAGVASIAYMLGIYTEYFIILPRFPTAIEQEIFVHIPYLGKIFPLENIGVKSITILVVVFLTWINYRSTRTAGNVQVVLTIIKVIAILLLIFGLLFSGAGSSTYFFTNSSTIHPEGWALVMAIMMAMSGAFWGYDGWNNITFIAGEIKNPQRNIPRALVVGVTICILIYTLMNLAYLYILPVDRIAQSEMVATDAIAVVLGGIGGALIALMVIISTFGTTNGNILATARVSFAMAQERMFFKSIGDVHSIFNTPAKALWLHAVWTCVLIISGSFDMLTDMLIFISWVFYGLSAFGIFILRRKMPNELRPYKAWGYPVVPAIFVVFTATFLIITLVNDISNYNAGNTSIIHSVLGLALTGTGIPLYWYFRRVNKKGNQ
ncbi:APC family permease [Pseudochryseolinea flava]|uniref:Amino acid permease n=1 Tax=Pseudochryseolinea flava TaxID=2059302 RepID=A0A364XYE6_9BACT|nr:amino acid permease [Pseudochryseolinea flava]RAV98603.1 amino acid permease [Pseudochryseolinea flava]